MNQTIHYNKMKKNLKNHANQDHVLQISVENHVKNVKNNQKLLYINSKNHLHFKFKTIMELLMKDASAERIYVHHPNNHLIFQNNLATNLNNAAKSLLLLSKWRTNILNINKNNDKIFFRKNKFHKSNSLHILIRPGVIIDNILINILKKCIKINNKYSNCLDPLNSYLKVLLI